MLEADIPTLEDFTETYIEYVRDIKQNRSWKSAILYLNSLNKRFGKKKLSQITPKDIDDLPIHKMYATADQKVIDVEVNDQHLI